MTEQQLAISLTQTSVHVAEVLCSTKVVLKEYSSVLPVGSVDDISTNLKSFFDGLPLKSEYKDVTIAWSDAISFMIPENTFHTSNAKDLFHFVIGEEADPAEIDYNRLPELSAVLVYTIPKWVKSFFFRRFPTAILQHEKGMIIRSLFQGDTYGLKLCVVLMEDYLSIHLLHKNELIFSNSFSYQSKEDIVYYTLYVLQQKEHMEEKGLLIGYGLSPTHVKELEAVFSTITDKKMLPHFKYTEVTNLIKPHIECV